METMRAIVLVTCGISMLSGVLHAMKPSARFDRQLRLIFSAVFVLGILTPLYRGAAAFQPDWEGAGDVSTWKLEETAAEETAAQAAKNLETSLTAMLREAGIEAQIGVAMHISGENRIEIEQVTAVCTDTSAAEQLLTDCLGNEVNLYVEKAS